VRGFIYSVTVTLLVVLLVGCGQSTPTSAPNEDPGETPAATLPSRTRDGAYIIAAVSLAQGDNLPANTPDAPAGSRYVVVTASLMNQADAPAVVTVDNVALIDTDGRRYPPDHDDDSLPTVLVETTVEPETSAFGLFRFLVPSNAAIDRLEWCPHAAGEVCTEAVQSPVPQP
jgi:hypothetical protein